MDKIERVARTICQAKGERPDQIIDGPIESKTETLPGGNVVHSMGPRPIPKWPEYVEQAKVFVAAHDAMTESTT